MPILDDIMLDDIMLDDMMDHGIIGPARREGMAIGREERPC